MSTVYSFSGFARVLIKNGIEFSIRDFLKPEKVDELIEKLIAKTCDEFSYIGAGIARACFVDGWGECAIKVNKEFYTDFSDEDARDSYSSYCWYEETPYVYGGWAINKLDEVVKSKSPCCEQNYEEISAYESFLEEKSNVLGYVSKIYAVSSNWQVEIVEYCDTCTDTITRENYNRRNFIYNNFVDAHDNNLGYNRQGQLVILDFGM